MSNAGTNREPHVSAEPLGNYWPCRFNELAVDQVGYLADTMLYASLIW